MTINEIVKGVIRDKKVRQNYLAREIGIKETTLSAKLNGQRKNEFGKLCNILDVSADEIIRHAQESNPNSRHLS